MHRYLKTKHKTQAAPTGSRVAASCPNLHEYLPVKDFSKQCSQYSPSGDKGRDGGNPYEQLLAHGFSKQEIHSVIYKFIMHEIARKKAYKQLPFTSKIIWHIKSYKWQATRFCKRLTAKGLVLLKTQFAKKPKQPV